MSSDHFQGPKRTQTVAILAARPGAPAWILSFLQQKLISCKTWELKRNPSGNEDISHILVKPAVLTSIDQPAVYSRKVVTHGPDSTMTEPTLCVFSSTSLHSPESSTFFPRKFSNSNAASCNTRARRQLDEVLQVPVSFFSPFVLKKSRYRKSSSFQTGTL